MGITMFLVNQRMRVLGVLACWGGKGVFPVPLSMFKSGELVGVEVPPSLSCNQSCPGLGNKTNVGGGRWCHDYFKAL